VPCFVFFKFFVPLYNITYRRRPISNFCTKNRDVKNDDFVPVLVRDNNTAQHTPENVDSPVVLFTAIRSGELQVIGLLQQRLKCFHIMLPHHSGEDLSVAACQSIRLSVCPSVCLILASNSGTEIYVESYKIWSY